MAKKKIAYVWQKQSGEDKSPTIECPSYDPYEDFRGDPSGYYVLIRTNFDSLTIEAAVCSNKHVVSGIFRGRKAQDVYEGIFRHEEKHKLSWFKSKSHMAYLGKELKKAEIALAMGQNSYFQE